MGEGLRRTAHVHASEELDSGAVPMNHSNKDGKPSAEGEEGKAADSGKQSSIRHALDTERGSRIPGVGECAQGSTGKEGDEVHRLAPPSEHRSAAGKLLFLKEESRTRRHAEDAQLAKNPVTICFYLF